MKRQTREPKQHIRILYPAGKVVKIVGHCKGAGVIQGEVVVRIDVWGDQRLCGKHVKDKSFFLVDPRCVCLHAETGEVLHQPYMIELKPHAWWCRWLAENPHWPAQEYRAVPETRNA